MMTTVLRAISVGACLATLLPSILMLTGSISHEQAKAIMLLATIVWFAATPFWMDRPDHDSRVQP